MPLNLKGVWEAMEECQRLGLTRAIGVSNFSIKKLENLLSFATIRPAVNQVEMNLAWQQKNLRDFCKANDIIITAFSPLRKGASRGPNEAMDNDVVKDIADDLMKLWTMMVKDIADAHGKSSAQVCLRWLYEQEELMPLNLKGIWGAMEECQRLGLAKAIGVSNFSIKKLENLLSFATIPPAVNQVEMNLAWQQKNLRDFCKANDIIITAFSPLRKGASRGPNEAMDNDVVKDIADAHGKSSAQVCLRWLYEQGVTFVPKSYNKERMNQNLQIFDWSLTEEDYEKISQIKQQRLISGPTKPQLKHLYDEEN
ncbi:hypothetical protein L6164_029041 [Bauhinia variegata]|uniref:Uncharacterized protein n=1 Tax=Bauhinia variegata TaxID=167791 RepID=A0ACB9L833_BAUVA|nr:hypothetical protein L6164_029041 [Bauhinia variegata]